MGAGAWTVEKGARAPQAAGAIHTDFERGFIRAETMSYQYYVTLGGEAAARDAGRLRSEGKDYVVHYGDIMPFRFNVMSGRRSPGPSHPPQIRVDRISPRPADTTN